MKRLLSIILLAVISSASALAQSDAEREVLKLYEGYEEAIAPRDASVHERLFADDYTYTPGNGNFMGREEHMNFIEKGSLVIGALRSEDTHVRVYGDTVIVAGLFVTTGRLRGKEPTEKNQVHPRLRPAGRALADRRRAKDRRRGAEPVRLNSVKKDR